MIDLVNYQEKVSQAVCQFWASRNRARKNQMKRGSSDLGERSSVTAGKNMNGFVSLFTDLVRANGLPNAEIMQSRSALTLPGFFRPAKVWDILVMNKKELVAVLELKSHIGPSYGNNFNNRAEEAIGSSLDFWTAYREGAFGIQPRPFAGWLILVEDSAKSRVPVKTVSPNFPLSEEFLEKSYLQRYDILCQKLIKEHLYTAACLITSSRNIQSKNNYFCLSSLTDLKTFAAAFAGHIAAVSARLS
ncbi:MAG: PaeR7I family type II restriction endonuclease [Planctomycetia bacterium]|nr:PaeR7I family type II restriction endonuclease [Planctomycetia bacterium]